MDKSKNNNNIWSVVILVVVVGVISVGAVYLSSPKPAQSSPALDTFAQCLASKKITMYGAAWCPHCQAQKALFGESFKYVPYVECPDNTALCIAKGVQGYPTWITAAGVSYEGEQPLSDLASTTGCVLTQ